ncbi:MAG: alcohol dehydrogenase catalytic domain-containing protein [Dermatophilaceae bacterium]
MKALVKAEAAPGLWLQDVPEPATGAGEVRIRVLRTGICGTDLHVAVVGRRGPKVRCARR